jgi:UDP-N-acetylglucosamine 4,6-dehydratase/5-epimerase
MDIAKSESEDCETKVIGRRPGEKIHEVLCPAGESHLTLEFNDHFVIMPTINLQDENIEYRTNNLGESGKLVSSDFSYSSDNNVENLTVEEIRELRDDNDL